MKTVSLIKCNNYEYKSVKDALINTFKNLGGIEKFVKKGSNVVLKPNLLMAFNPSKAVTTHPSIIHALTSILTEAGAKVILAESPGGPYIKSALKKVYKVCGMQEIAEFCDLNLNYDLSIVKKEIINGTVLKNIEILKPLADADLIINLPKLKTHGMMTYTGAVKNMFGAIPGIQKAEYHFKLAKYDHFANGLIDIFLNVKPVLSIIDAVVGMEGEGPSAGRPIPLNFIAASEDAFALDFLCLNIVSAKVEEVPVMAKAQERNLAPSSLDEISIIGNSIDEFKIKNYHFPPADKMTSITFFDNPHLNKILNCIKSKPKVKFSSCVGCGICVESCPAKVIEIKEKKAHINLTECIRCFCCHELCPKHAIKMKKLPRFLELFFAGLILILSVILPKKRKKRSKDNNK